MNKLKKNHRVNFIKKLISFLNKKKIKFIFLTDNKKFIYEENKDIDIIIKFKNFSNLKKKLYLFAEINNFYIANIIQHEFNAFTFIFTKKNDLDFNISLDISKNYYVEKTIKIFDINLKDTVDVNILNKNVKFPSKESFFYYYFYKKIFKNDININSYKFLKKKFKNVNLKKLELYFSKIDIFLMKRIFQFNDFINLKNYRNIFFIKSCLNFNPINIIFELSRLFKRLKTKTGLHISFIGIDGSGKSTLINQFFKKKNTFFKNIYSFHLYKPLSNNSLINKKEPYLKKNYGIFLSFFKILFLYSHFLYSFYFHILPKKIRSSLILNDRYFDDIWIDSQRFRISKYFGFINFLYFFQPRPDITFIILADKKNILQRSKELNIKKITMLNKNLKKISEVHKNSYKINANRHPNKIYLELTEIVKKYQHQKFKK